jgi:hypothetical protein
MIAQLLCITAIAAVFLATPLVSFAGNCGGGGNKNVQPNKQGTILGVVNQVSKILPPGTTIVNGAVPIPGTPGGMVTLNTNFKFTDLQPGTWISGVYQGVPFQGTIFSISKVNGGKNTVAEVWVADPAPNSKNVKPGLIVKNFDLTNIVAAATSSASASNN